MRGTFESNIRANTADTATVDPNIRIFEPSTPRRTRAILWLRQPRRRSTWADSHEMLARDGDVLTDEKETRIAATSQGSHGDSDKLFRGGTRTPGGSKNPHGNKSLSPNPGAFRRRLRPPRSRSRSGSVGSLSRMVGGGSSGGGPLADLVPVDVTRSFKPDLATDADSGDDDTPDPGHVLNSSSEWSSSGVEASGEKKSPRGMIGIIKRRFKGKTIGGSGSMTIGRATLASGRREGLLSPPGSDYYEGARTDEFPKRSASPARNIPVEWSSSIPSTAALTPSEASSGGLSPLPPRRLNQQQQQQHLRRQSSPPGTSSSMARGVSAPAATPGYTSQSPLRHLDRVGQKQYRRRQSFTDESSAMVKEISAPGANTDCASNLFSEEQDWAMQQQKVEGVGYSSGLGQADEPEVNGRGRSKVSGEKGGRRGSLSPARRLMAAAVAAASAAVSASVVKEQDKVVSPKKGGGGSSPGGNTPDSTSMKQLDVSEAGAMSEGTPSERRGSVQSIQGYDCVVEPAPPSTVKYGDRLRLWAKILPSDSGSMSLESGYVGSLDKVTRVHQRLFRRSESAVINLSGGTVSGFIDRHFKVVDPEGKRGVGDVVNLGDAVLLVDDRDFIWSYSTKGSATPIRMKLRDSAKHHIAVCFRPAHGGSTDAPPKDNIPIVFGPDELSIVPVSQGVKDSKRRRMASRKNYPLTTFLKKPSSGSSKSSMAKLSADGGGDRVVFVLHLPNASPAGDPSPVVIKVVINANELERQKQQQQQNHQRRRSSIVSIQGREDGRSKASAVHMPGGEGIEHRPNLSGGSVHAVKGDSINTPFISELQHEREDSSRSSGNYSSYSSNSRITGGSGSSRDVDVGVSQELSLSSESLQKGVLSPCRSPGGAEGEDEEGDEDDDYYTEEEGVEVKDGLGEGGDRLGSIEGLKWGEFVQFKLPGEHEVSPEDAMVTLDLSNGCSASVTSKQLRQNSGRKRFPVAAKYVNARGVSSKETNVGCGGTVYLRCTLSPFVCCDGNETFDDEVTACATFQQKMAGVADTGGKGFVETHGKAFSYRARRTSFKRKSAIIVFLASAVVIISTTTKMPANVEVKLSPMLSTMTDKVEIPVASDLAACQCPIPCTSVWDLRRPDGTSYTHEQLLAAAAILGEEPVGEGLKGNRSHGEAGGGRIERGGSWTRLCSIVFAMLASGFLIIDKLLGSGMGDNVRHEPSPSATMPAPPMQAKVHLLEWDGRRMTEEEAIAEEQAASSDIERIYYPPPSGSELLPMPHRFALAENMDMAKAWQRWGATLAWRKENNVDSLLSKPHPRFSLIKSMYPHCFHLPDKDGRLTYYERPGMFDINQLKKAGITKQDLVDHYVYCMEYLWQELQPKQSQKLTIVIDLEGVGMRDLAGESVGFLKTTVGIMSRHFPQRSFKIFILNAPSFFNMVFAVVKPLLNEATKKKIEVLQPAVASRGLLKVIPAESLPPNYGGTCQVSLTESPAEASLLAHVRKMLEKNGEKMEPVS